MNRLTRTAFCLVFIGGCRAATPQRLTTHPGEASITVERLQYLVGMKMADLDCPEPSELARDRDYCPAVDIIVAPDGTVTQARLAGPPEFLTEQIANCWQLNMMSWRFPATTRGLQLNAYTFTCIGFLTKPEPGYLEY